MKSQDWQTGKVRWFDKASGKGLIESENGELFDVHYSAIKSDKKQKNLRENRRVQFRPFEDNNYKIAKVVKELAA